MTRIIGLLVLFLATLTLGGCAGMPLDLNGYGNGASGYGYGASCPQPYGGGMPGYAMAAPPVIYAPQPQPYYAPQPYDYNYNGGNVYAPAQPGPRGGPWIDQRERYQAERLRQGRRDGSLTPYEAQRLGAEPRHIRGAEGRMRADGNFSPQERGRLNTMPNRANQDIYGARHNGMGQPGAAGPQRGNGPMGPMGSRGQHGAPVAYPGNGHGGPMSSNGQPQIHGGQTHGGMQPQARSLQPGAAPRARGTAEATPGQ